MIQLDYIDLSNVISFSASFLIHVFIIFVFKASKVINGLNDGVIDNVLPESFLHNQIKET